jgi:hypothetical protein
MAATRTRNTFRPRPMKVAVGLCPGALRRNGGRDQLGGSDMITMAIAWALVLALFRFTAEKSNERRFSR